MDAPVPSRDASLDATSFPLSCKSPVETCSDGAAFPISSVGSDSRRVFVRLSTRAPATVSSREDRGGSSERETIAPKSSSPNRGEPMGVGKAEVGTEVGRLDG